MRTTEFWLMVAFGVMLLANGTEFIAVPWDTLTWFGGMVAVYTGGRSAVKAIPSRAPKAGEAADG